MTDCTYTGPMFQIGHRQWGRSNDGGSTYKSTGTDPTLTAPVTAHWTGIVGSIQSLNAGKLLVYG